MSHHHTTYLDGLRQAGHRLTPQREMILSVICESGGHLTADAILQRVRVRYPYLNKSAVYRTLELLARLGLVNPTDLGHGQVEYEVHRDPHHHHLVCQRCGRITEVEQRVFAALDKQLREKYEFAAELDHFAIFGTCKRCQKTSVAGSRH